MRRVLMLPLLVLLSCTTKEERAFRAAKAKGTVQAFTSFISEYPGGSLASRAESLLVGVLPPVPFTSNQDARFNVFTVRVDGTGLRCLSDTQQHEITPMLSPEGERIAFVSGRAGGEDVFIMRLDGTEARQVTKDMSGVRDPAWSPDGARIAFVSERGRNDEIFVINVDGSGLTRLTTTPGAETYPTWSPDGRRLAFAYQASREPSRALSTARGDFYITRDLFTLAASQADIWVMNVDGSGRTQLTRQRGNDTHPSWSPDGSRIAFSSDRDGNDEIYLMNPDGSDVVRLTEDPASDRLPLWYPLWNRILFTSDRGGGVDVWMMKPDGSDLTRLTTREGSDFVR